MIKTISNLKNGNNTNFNSTWFNVTNNPDLFCIDVDNATWSTTNWTNKDDQTLFSEDCHNFTWVPDDNFEQALIDLGYDDYMDDYVLTANINTVSSLDVSSKGISYLTGIEDFAALTFLDCSDNNLSSLDISDNTALITLNCHTNNLSSLNTSSNSALTYLTCYTNNITSLDISSNPELTYLSCANNNLSNLEVTGNTALKYLYFDRNSISIIDVSSNTALIYLTCDGNSLSSLDISNNTALTALFCSSNSITALDVSNNTALEYLSCGSNNISSLDVSNNIALIDLSCSDNNLSNLDLTVNSALKSLICADNDLSDLNISYNPAVVSLSCDNNDLTSLNVRNGNNTNYTLFTAVNNPDLYCIQVDNATWSTTNWTNIDSQSYFSENCGLSVDENDLKSSLTIYPNPVTDVLTVELNNNLQLKSVNIYNILGKVVIQTDKTVFNLEQLSSGLYILQVETNNGTVNKRIVKK